MTCDLCLIERTTGPCPHNALRAVKDHARERFEQGIRVGFDGLLALLPFVKSRAARGAVQTQLAMVVRQIERENYPLAEAWRTEAKVAMEEHWTR